MVIEAQNWDTEGVNWDAGFQWDVNLGPNNGDPQPFLDLVTSEHNDKPKFMETLLALVQPLADNIATMRSMPPAFDLDVSVGDQEDKTGQWIGRSRYLSVPLEGVYFSFDTDGLGFDEGVWQGPFDPNSGLEALPDEEYRTLLKATVVANQWTGTVPDAYEAYDVLFGPEGLSILIFDNQNMTMDLGFVGIGVPPDAVTLALLTGGYLNLKPAGVRVTGYWIPTEPGPMFGFDAENDTIAGFDNGSWAEFLPPT